MHHYKASFVWSGRGGVCEILVYRGKQTSLVLGLEPEVKYGICSIETAEGIVEGIVEALD